MSTPSPADPDHATQPHWQAPAAAAGAMAAGLMVGRNKSALGLALGMAAMAGARWLMKRQARNGAAAPPTKSPLQEAGVIPAQERPVLAKTVESISTASAVEEPPPVMIYEQLGEMPSYSAAAEGTVWFALFNEAPQGPDSAARLAEPPSGGPAQIVSGEKEVFDGGSLPESFFSEAPGMVESGEEKSPEAGQLPITPIELLTEGAPGMQTVGVDAPEQVVKPASEIILGNQEELFLNQPPQVVPKPLMDTAERVPRPASSVPLPQKRASGEPPRAWVVPTSEKQLTLQSKKNPGAASVHRSIVPHEMMTESPTGVLRWPMVTAAMVLLLAVVAMVVVGSGLDGGLVREWKERWMSFRPTATMPEESNRGLWPGEGAKVVASPPIGK